MAEGLLVVDVIGGETVNFSQSFSLQNRICKAGSIIAGLPSHNGKRSAVNAKSFIRDHQIHIEFHLISQAKAFRASPKRVIIFDRAKKSGYVRVRVDGNLYELSEEIKLDKNIKHNIEIVVDLRFVDFWSIEIAGESPSIFSTFGFSI